MSFLTPIWLLSIAAISIPVFIHLWNVRPGKTLKVGSISLIDTSSRKRSRSFNLLDVLLLLLRSLLLIILAFVLAMPFLQKQLDKSVIKGWLLIPKENFREAYQHFKPKADSLIKAGYELHYFNADFAKLNLQQALADSAHLKNNDNTSYWNLLQQLNRKIPASLPVYLITPNQLDKFSGDKPSIGLKLQWQTYTPTDSVSTQIAKAWFTNTKDIHVLSVTSKPSGTEYHTENIDQSNAKSTAYDINIANGKATINLKNNHEQAIEIDSTAINATIFAGTNTQDANYLKAALQAVGQFTQRNITVKTFNNNETAAVKKDWLFWLADQPVNENISKHYSNVFIYQQGKIQNENGRINTGDLNQQPIALYKSITGNIQPGENIWQDGFGKPLLTKEVKDQTNVYHFYSHFNPTWNELVWNNSFPKLMLQLIIPAGDLNKNMPDRRKIESHQLQPNFGDTNSTVNNSYKSSTDLTHYFWLALVLIFFIERWLAHKKQLES